MCSSTSATPYLHTLITFMTSLIAVLVATNVTLYLYFTREVRVQQLGNYIKHSSNFTRLTCLPGYQVPHHVIQSIRTEPSYASLNRSIADAAWNNYTVNGHVALTTTWAANHGLNTGETKMPGDDGKSIYVVDAFHQLHCLVGFFASLFQPKSSNARVKLT